MHRSTTHSHSNTGTSEDGTDYWIGRNSWGTFWGDNGFFQIVRGVDNLGIEGNCQFATPLRNEKTGEFEFPVERAIIKDEVSEKSQPCRTENTTFVLDESARVTQPLPHTYVLFEFEFFTYSE